MKKEISRIWVTVGTELKMVKFGRNESIKLYDLTSQKRLGRLMGVLLKYPVDVGLYQDGFTVNYSPCKYTHTLVFWGD